MANGRAWLEQHTAALIRMNAAGDTDAEIGTVTGHAAITVFYRRKALGLPAGKRPRRRVLRIPASAHRAASKPPSQHPACKPNIKHDYMSP